MATRVRLKRHRAIIIILSFPSRCVYYYFFLHFFFNLSCVLVARAAVTRFLLSLARTHTHTCTHTHHLSSIPLPSPLPPFRLPRLLARRTDNYVYLMTTHRRAPVSLPFPIFLCCSGFCCCFFLSNLWLYEYILNNRLITLCDIMAVSQPSFWCSRLMATMTV